MVFKFLQRICLTSILVFYSIILSQSCSNQKNSDKSIDFQEVAPIVHKKCAVCHKTGEAAPFNLISYSDIKQHANKVRFAIQNNYMPPWPADTNYTRFDNEIILTAGEKEKILNWIENDCPAKDTLLSYQEMIRSVSSREPDLIVRFQQAIYLNGNGTDHFFVVKMPYQLEKDTFVQYVEFVPSQKKLVHHVNGHLLRYEPHRKFNYYKGVAYFEEPVENYLEVYKKMGLTYKDVKENDPKKILPSLIPNTVYYLPGFLTLRYREGIGGFFLPRNGVFLLNDIHYGPSHKGCLDSSYLKIYFAPKRPHRYVYEGQLGTHGMSKITPPLIIPPNTIKTFTTSLIIPVDISILAVNPHMHLLGQSFWAFAVTPMKDTIPLIKIPKWNFNWQYYYIFKKPVVVPKGSLIVAIGTYNNTSDNPYNPNYPPIEVKEGDGFHSMRAKDEMFQFFFQYMIYQSGDDTINLSP